MPERLTLVGAAGVRLDRFLADQRADLSRSYAQKLIDDGRVTVDGKPARAGLRLAGGEHVVVELPDPAPAAPIPQPIPLTILYEDDDVIVVNKPAGLVVHPAAGHADGTLVNALLAHVGGGLPGINGTQRPGIVHRLDKDTSGVMVAAKTARAERSLAKQFRDGTVTKRYLALVVGQPANEDGMIDAPIGRDSRYRHKMAITHDGREAKTRYRLLRRVGPYSLLECTLLTGRTHQIRVHLAAIGHPVVGDTVYNARASASGLARQFLHAAALGFRRPSDHRYVEFRAELPDDLATFLARFPAAASTDLVEAEAPPGRSPR